MAGSVTKKAGYAVEYIALIVTIVIVWCVMAGRGTLNEIIMPAPSQVIDTVVSLISSGTLWTNLVISVVRVM